MTAQIDLIAPATITLLGSLVESLDPVPLLVAGSGTLTVSIMAGNAGAQLSASAASGANVSTIGNTLTLGGTAAQINAALASLQLVDTGVDTLSLAASGAGFMAAGTDIAVETIPAQGPAFVAPPATIALASYSLLNIGGLVLADPAAAALAAAGLGRSETMAVTLSVASGVLLLSSYSALGGISAAGVGTSEIILGFTADQLAAVNTLLAGLEWAGPAAVSGLAYAARDVSGPLGATVTSGNIALNISGVQGPLATVSAGAGAAILGVSSFGVGNVLNFAGVTADIGGIEGQGAVFIMPGAALDVPYNQLTLDGTSYDFGGLAAQSFSEAGSLLAASGAAFAGLVNAGSAAEIDFNGSFTAGAADTVAGLLDISLAAGGLITGGGVLTAGNFSESGLITGAGTILAGAGETLLINAGQITSVSLEVAAGGVLELGPIAPLYGVFNATALTVGPSVTLSFLGDSGAQSPAGGFADTLAQTGGVIVISSPALFEGQIINFQPGDRLIFPGLTGLTLASITSSGFIVRGPDRSGVTQTYTINAAIPAGSTPFTGIDAAGDGEVSLRDAQPDVFLGGTTISQTALAAQPGTAQPLAGFSVLARSWNGQTVSVTLAVSKGLISGPGVTSAAQVTITSASPAALNQELQALFYTANANALSDLLTITSASAAFSGLYNILPIALSASSATTAGYFGDAAQIALFSDHAAVPVQAVAAPGELIVTSAKVFDSALTIPGLSGTALLVASGAISIFDPGSAINLGADATVGSSGLLDVLTDEFSVSGNISIAGTAIITGAVQAGGSLALTGTIMTSGMLQAGTASIASGALLENSGSIGFQMLTINGALADVSAAAFSVQTLISAGNLMLGGTSDLFTASAVEISGTINLGPDAVFTAKNFVQAGGIFGLSGFASFAGGANFAGLIDLSGGTLLSPMMSFGSAALLDGYGVIGAGTTLGTLFDSGTILASGGLMLIADDVTLGSGAVLDIAGTSALDVVHAVSGGTIGFAGPASELTINDVSQFNAAIGGMQASDAVDLVGVAKSLVSFTQGGILVESQAGLTVGSFALGIDVGQPMISLVSDGAGGTLITLGGDMPCFARGTRLLTPNGYRPVETLRPGDPVITLAGERRAVRWVGWRTLDLQGHDRAQPVLFAANALAPGVPRRPVCLSPLHAVLIDGVLVPACHLVNGATIVSARQPAVTYFHVELDRHEILLADGMPAESYRDTGNRSQLYTEFGLRGRAGPACAELVTNGPKLAAIRQKLHEIALQAGFHLTYQPKLRGVAGSLAVVPREVRRRGRREMRFGFARPAGELALVAQTWSPAETDPGSEDRRQLGICLKGIPDGTRLGQGWFARDDGDAGIWMGAGAELAFCGAPRRTVTLQLAAVIQSWVPPAPVIMR